MGFAERVSAGDEGHRLLVIHRHACEGLPNITYRSGRIRLAIGPLPIHAAQAPLKRRARSGDLTVAAVALVCQPLALRPPGNGLVGLPDVLAPTGETGGLESHRLQCDVRSEEHTSELQSLRHLVCR